MTAAAASKGSAALIAGGQAAVKSTQLVVALVLVRLLSAQAWNQVAFVLSIHLAVVTFGALGLQHGLLYYLARDPHNARQLVIRTAGITSAVGLIISAVLWAAADAIGHQLSVSGVLPIIGLAATLELCAAGVPSAFIGLQRFRAAALWDLGNSVVVVAFVTLAAVWRGSVGAMAMALLLAGLVRVFASAFVLVTFESGHHDEHTHRIGIREQLVYSLPLGLTLGANVINRTIDKWYVAAFEPSQIGLYSIAAQEVPLLAVLPYAGGAVVATQLAKSFQHGDTQRAAELWIGQTRTMARVVVPMTVTLMLVAPEVFSTLVGTDSTSAVLTFQLFTAITLHRVAEYGLLLRVAGRPRTVLTSALVLLGANALLALVGVLLAGPVGAAAGTLAANVVAWLFVLHQVAHALNTDLRHCFPWREWSTSLALWGVAALLAAQLSSMAHSTVAILLMKVGAVTALVAASWLAQRAKQVPSHPTVRGAA